MASLIWGAWGEEWSLSEKVSFNGVTKQITVNAGVTSLVIGPDVYSAWKRWVIRDANAMFFAAMRATGNDPIPGGATGSTYFLQNGWKLIYDPTLVAVSGVLYSEDFGTAYWLANGSPVYPATVSALVNNAVSYQNVVTGTAASPAEIWAHSSRSLTESLDASAAQIASAVLAILQSTAIPANMVQVKGQALTGSGSEVDPWGP